MGIMTTCYFTGQFISPVLFEPMIANLGFQLFFIYLAMTIASVAVLVAGIYLLNQKKWLKQPD